MVDKLINFLSNFLSKLESRFGLVTTSVLLSLILSCIAIIYVQPVFTVAFHGIQYSELSKHPFDFSRINNMQYRILAPLLGYLFFLRGNLFFILPIIFIFLFQATAYYSFRKKNKEQLDALLLTCFISFSCIVLLPLVAPGYTDIITWFFIFLAFIHAEKNFRSALFFSLALLNHESSVAVLPGLILYSGWLRRSGYLKIILLYVISCIPHLLYRQFVDSHAVPLYSASFYLSKSNIDFVMSKAVLYLPAAIFYAFKLWWIFPLCFVIWSFGIKKFFQITIIASIVLGAFSLAFIGYDYTRMVVIAFPAVLISHEWLKEIIEVQKLRKLTLILIVLNFFILQYHFNFDGAQPMFPWILNKISAHFGMPLV